MNIKLPLDTVLFALEKADLSSSAEAVDLINSLDFYQYSQEELKSISDKLSERLSHLVYLELRSTHKRNI